MTCIISRRILVENERLLQWVVFFRRVRSKISLNTDVQNILETSEPRPKKNKNIDIQNLESIGSPLCGFSLGFFGTMRLF